MRLWLEWFWFDTDIALKTYSHLTFWFWTIQNLPQMTSSLLGCFILRHTELFWKNVTIQNISFSELNTYIIRVRFQTIEMYIEKSLNWQRIEWLSPQRNLIGMNKHTYSLSGSCKKNAGGGEHLPLLRLIKLIKTRLGAIF